MLRHQKGQSLVEFALVAPLLLAIIAGIMELSILFGIYVGLTNSAREAARAGAVYRYTKAAPLSTDTTAVAMIDGQRGQYVSAMITQTLNPMVSPTLITSTLSYTPTTATNPYRAGDTINVHLEYRHRLFFGLIGRDPILLQADSAMRIEPGGAQ